MDQFFVMLGLVVMVAPFVLLRLLFRQGADLRALKRELAELRERVERGDAPRVERPEPAAVADSTLRSSDIEPAETGDASPDVASDGEPQPPAAERAVAATPAATPAADPTPAPRNSGDLESFVGGRLLLIIGVVAVLLALAFLFRLAVDRGWIGPAARIGLGAVAGLVALFGGDRLRARGFTVYGHALMGAGLAALLLCSFVSSLRYELISREAAFVLTGVLTALGALLAVWRDAQLLAWLGFLGGLVAPMLLGRNEDALGPLTIWLIVLQLGVAAVMVVRPWRGLDAFAGGLSVIYMIGWHSRWFSPDDVARLGLCFGGMQLALMALALAPAWLARREPDATSLAVLVVGSLALFAQTSVSLSTQPEQYALAAVSAGFALLFLALARAFERRHGLRTLIAPVLDGMGLAAIALALGRALGDDGLPPAWAACGVITMLISARSPRLVFRVASPLFLAGAGVALLNRGLPWHAGDFIPGLNIAFASALSPFVGALLAGRILERAPLVEGGDAPRIQMHALCFRVVAVWGAMLVLGRETVETVRADDLGAMGIGRSELVALTTVFSVYTVICALIWGRRSPQLGLLPVGPLAVATMLSLRLVESPHAEGFRALINDSFGAGCSAVLAAVIVGRLCFGGVSRAAWIVAGSLLLVLLTREVHAWGELAELEQLNREQMQLAAQVGISSLWTIYGAVLLGAGFRLKQEKLRWAGLIVLLIAVGKVFLFDLSTLDVFWRISSFLVLGILLLGASFLYQRAQRAREPG